MSVKINFSYYSEICGMTMYGKNFLELDEIIIDGLDDFMDGLEIDFEGAYHPDNVWVNSYTEISDSEVVQEFLSKKGKSSDDVDSSEFIAEHEEEIKSFISEFYEDYSYLGHADKGFHFLQ